MHPRSIVTLFEGARHRVANDEEYDEWYDRTAELKLLEVISECVDGCSLDVFRGEVIEYLLALGYRELLVTEWVDERIAGAWRRFEREKEANDG